MNEEEHQRQRVLYIISCGSPVAQMIPELVTQAQVGRLECVRYYNPTWNQISGYSFA